MYERVKLSIHFAQQIGMLNMYNLGVHLRTIYDEFLGEIYMQETTKMQTAEYPLSILAGQLVNAGLWPPAKQQRWNADINWQPIPIGSRIRENMCVRMRDCV